MSHPKLSMRDVRRHPATITNPAELEQGLAVVRCHLIEPIGRGTRMAQAIFVLSGQKKPEYASRLTEAKHAYRHTPHWGIILNEVATIKWINTDAMFGPYLSLDVTRTSGHMSFRDRYATLTADSVDAVAQLIDDVPAVEPFVIERFFREDEVRNSEEHTLHFNDVGLAPDLYGLNQFLLDRSKLPQSQTTA